MINLDSKGIAHLLIPLIVVIVGVAAIGTYMLVSSSAASNSKTKGLLPVHISMTKEAKAKFLQEAKARNTPKQHDYTFIKVGDSITAAHYSLYGLGCYKPKNLDSQSNYYKTIMRYRQDKVNFGNRKDADETCANSSDAAKRNANSWNRVSYAAAKGATSAYPLATAQQAGIDRENCGGTQKLIECELSIVKPRYAFIQFGTNDARVIGHDLGKKKLRPAGSKMSQEELNLFKQNLERQVRLVRSYKATPILITVPSAKVSKQFTRGANARIAQVNGAIRQVARESAVPLIDFHAAQARQDGGKYASNAGLDPGGLHPATYGMSKQDFDQQLRTGKSTSRLFETSTDFEAPAVKNNGMNLRNLLIVDALTRLDATANKQ